MNLLVLYHETNQKSSAQNIIPALRGWNPPSESCYKLNIEYAIARDKGYGLGMIVRDNAGRVMMLATKNVKQNLEVCEAEAFAVVFGIRSVYDADF